MKKLSILVLIFFPLSLLSQGYDDYINIHFYPHIITPQDTLQIGPDGKKINISEDTLLVWVDLFPGLFFAHKTAYILISKKRVRIKRGNWWPELNGKMILHNELSKYALVSPFEIPRNESVGERIAVYVYPHELDSQDQLTDGPTEKLFKLYDNCLLIWVDLLPDAFFAHPTAYILISKDNTRVEDGQWWPELNGNIILYGQPNKTGIISPFKVSYGLGLNFF
jgi:hypothetical protein